MIGLRKFIVAMYFGTWCFILCLLHCMGGVETATCVATLAGLYKWANVAEKKNVG